MIDGYAFEGARGERSEPEGPPSAALDTKRLAEQGADKVLCEDTVAASAERSLFDYSHDYPITEGSFNIPGLGRAGLLCGHNRMSHFSSDGKAVRYNPLRCRRIECPKCWKDWMRRAAFVIVMKVEALARSEGKRPLSCIFSVSPEKVVKGSWSWDRVGTSLFRRGYRRSRSHGVDGGVAVFHPYRVKPFWKRRFRRSGEHTEIGFWKRIRERVEHGERLHEFVKLGPHVHSIVFGEPEAHSCKDFVLAFRDDDENTPKTLKSVNDVVGLVIYLITHSGVLTQMKRYKRGVQRRKTHTVRFFGSLHSVNPAELLPPAALEALARQVAGMLGMVWADGGLRYPASVKDFDTSEADIEWVPIHKLNTYLSDEAWLSGLSYVQGRFWLGVLWWMLKKGRPPNVDELAPPDDVLVFEVNPSAGDAEVEGFASSIQVKLGGG